MKILLIEDEPLIAESLESYIRSAQADAEIFGPLARKEEIEDFFNSQTVDLIFSDIQLEDCISIDILQEVRVTAPIIFCTAFNEFALRAFDVNGIHYILKPYSKEDIQKAFEKFENLSASSTTDQWQVLERIMKERTQKTERIMIHQGDRIIPVATENIALVLLENEIVYAYTYDGNKFMLNDTLNNLHERMESTHFRVNRQSIIHHDNIDYVTHYFNRKLKVYPKVGDSEQLVVSKTNTSTFLSWLK